MDPTTLAAIIYGGASALGTGASIIGGGKLNKKNRDWQEKMYAKQVLDNRYNADVAFDRQNFLLNSQREFELKTSDPAFQMNRYISAGLNPNLVAGSLSGSVNSPSVPSVSQAEGAGVQPFNMSNPLAELPQMLSGIADTVTTMYNTKYSAENIKSQVENREHVNKQIDEGIKKLQADTKLTDAQVDLIRTNIKKIESDLFELRPKELRKLDDESAKAAAELKKLLQEVDQSGQMFPHQLEMLKSNLSILKDNEHISSKNREKFDKEYTHLMGNLEKMFRLDDVTLDNALNAADMANVQSTMQSDIMREIRNVYDSIDPNESSWSRVSKFMMGSLILLMVKEMSGLPTMHDMYMEGQENNRRNRADQRETFRTFTGH